MHFYMRGYLKKMNKYKWLYVPTSFFILCILMILVSDVSANFILGQLYARFIRNAVFVLALIIPIMSGMGINFAITIGAMASQIAMIIVIDMKLTGPDSFIVAAILSVILATIFGNIIGYLLNKAKGKEMIASIVIGLIGTNLYQLLFMVGYGTIIKPFNNDILLSRGIGVKSMLDCMHFKDIFSKYISFEIGYTDVYLIPLLIVFMMAFFIYLIYKSKLGHHIKAVGDDMDVAAKLGIDVNATRRISIVISTVLASLANLMFVQDMGIVNVYTGHLKLDIFAAAALLAGGATFRRATIKNAFMGLLLFHTLFIISPIAGQTIFKNPALGEYFRSFIAYGTIVCALMINLKHEKEESRQLI